MFKFFKKIIAFFKDIGNFIKSLGKFITTLFKIILTSIEIIVFIIQPENFLRYIIPGIIYIFIMFLLLFLKISILGVPLGGVIIGQMCWLITMIVGAFKLTTFIFIETTSLLMVTIVYILDFFIPGLERIVYRTFLANEMHPFSWFLVSGIHQGNTLQRLFPGFFVFRPCGEGYIPSPIVPYMCQKIPNYIPSRCPTAIVKYAHASQKLPKGILEPRAFDLNASSINIWTALQKRVFKEDYTNFTTDINDYYTSCKDSMTAYQPISKAICRSAFSDPENGRMIRLCYNEHCRAGNYESFCLQTERAISNGMTLQNVMYEMGWDKSLTLSRTCGIILLATITSITAITILNNRD